MNATPIQICNGAAGLGVGNPVWVNVGNITADDTNYSTCTFTPASIGVVGGKIYASRFNWSPAIPSNAIIYGVVVSLKRKASSATFPVQIKNYTLYLVDDTGTERTDWKNNGGSTVWPTRESTENLGSSTDDWNSGKAIRGWMVNNANFGCALAVTCGSVPVLGSIVASLNAVWITLTYRVGRQTLTSVGI